MRGNRIKRLAGIMAVGSVLAAAPLLAQTQVGVPTSPIPITGSFGITQSGVPINIGAQAPLVPSPVPFAPDTSQLGTTSLPNSAIGFPPSTTPLNSLPSATIGLPSTTIGLPSTTIGLPTTTTALPTPLGTASTLPGTVSLGNPTIGGTVSLGTTPSLGAANVTLGGTPLLLGAAPLGAGGLESTSRSTIGFGTSTGFGTTAVGTVDFDTGLGTTGVILSPTLSPTPTEFRR